MMSILHLLEDFTTTDPAETATLLMSSLELEEQRLAAFENGYAAGWDDSVSADAQGRARLSEILTQNLRDTVFSYHEAMAQMQKALIPLFDAISEQLLPALIETGLPMRLAPALQDISTDVMARPLVLSVPRGAESSISQLMPAEIGIEMVVEGDDSLTEGQVRLHLDDGGIDIDLTALADEMRDAFAAFAFEANKELTRDKRA